jgi:hypothetical protein
MSWHLTFASAVSVTLDPQTTFRLAEAGLRIRMHSKADELIQGTPLSRSPFQNNLIQGFWRGMLLQFHDCSYIFPHDAAEISKARRYGDRCETDIESQLVRGSTCKVTYALMAGIRMTHQLL